MTPVPTVALEPVVGAVNETDVGVTAVTAILLEVTVVLAESITLAVSVKLPAAEGVQVTE